MNTCYTPQQLEVAYGVQPLLQRGIDGRGETVVLPELAESQLSPPEVTDLRQDFAAFDRLFHLPAPRLRFVSTFAGPKDPWLAYGEEVLDAEMVHTIAPRAALTIVLVRGTSLDSADQAVAASVAALRLGASEGGIISLSPAGQIGGEHCVDHAQLTQLNAALQADADHHVTVVAATGDAGAAGEPCALIDALSGGISRSFTPRKEVEPRRLRPARPQRRGHDPRREPHDRRLDRRDHLGPSRRQPRHRLPGIGRGVQPSLPPALLPERCAGHRRRCAASPTCSDADANPNTGFPVVTSNAGGGYTISEHGGTSASAPIWAGIIALADQYAGRHLGFVNPAIYQIARSSHYHQAFHDITTGNANTAEVPPRDNHRLPSRPGLGPRNRLGQPERQGARAPARSLRKPLTLQRSERNAVRAGTCADSRARVAARA